MIKPKALKQGDTVGVVAPSDAVEKEGVERSIEIIKSWGLKVRVGKHVYAKVGDFMAGTAEERIEDLKSMIYDDEVKAIWSASGGYAVTEVAPMFNKEVIGYLQDHPKLFIGYSDVCLILNALTSFKMTSIMGPCVWGLYEWDKKTQAMLKKMMFGEEVLGIGPESKWKAYLPGVAEGDIVASNLQLLVYSFGSRFDPLMYGNSDVILVIEEWDTEKCEIQRQVDIILGHKRAKRIKGMVWGRFVGIKELSYPEWGKKVSPESLVRDRAKKFGIPLAFCYDLGHAEWDMGRFPEIKRWFSNRKFLSVPNRIKAKLTVGEKECKLEYLESVCQVENEQRMATS